MPLSTVELAIPAALLGLGSHLGYFIHGEHHTSNGRLLSLALFGPPFLSLFLTVLRNMSLQQGVTSAAVIAGSFAGSLFTSILVYRLLFHPLRNYPGPVAARASKFWQMQKTITSYNTYRLLDSLHAIYGPYVRTGPNELSIVDPEIVEAVYGPHSKCKKGPWYDQSLPLTSLQQMRDRATHDLRRRAGWDKAFNAKSLRAYDSRVIGFADKLVERIESSGGKPMNISKWLSYFGYDVMGSLGFGRSFNTLESGDSHFYIELSEKGMMSLKFLGCIPWFTNLLAIIPGEINPIQKLLNYSEKCVEERKLESEKQDQDVIGHLIEAENFYEDPKLNRMLLTGDSRLIIIAGSDTTSCTLTYAFYYIAKDPSIADKIRSELRDNNVSMEGDFSIPSLQNLSYLNGVINESLRLHPPVPGGVFRQSPPEGLQIGNHYIPGNVNLLVPTYTLQRSSTSFLKPESFIPERWSSEPDLVINKNAFMPFSVGPYSCIGKHLAMGEMRTVISKIVSDFDVKFAPNETGEAIFKDEKDCFVLSPGKLDLCFIRRATPN